MSILFRIKNSGQLPSRSKEKTVKTPFIRAKNMKIRGKTAHFKKNKNNC
jgi:hypothetical protein